MAVRMSTLLLLFSACGAEARQYADGARPALIGHSRLADLRGGGITDVSVAGVQLFEETPPGTPMPFQMTRNLYHFLDVILSVGFFIPPFFSQICVLGSPAFWVSLIGIVIHNISHVLTNWGSTIAWLQPLSAKLFPLRVHTPVDVAFSGPIVWLAFIASSDDGLKVAGKWLYRAAAAAVAIIYPTIVFRMAEP